MKNKKIDLEMRLNFVLLILIFFLRKDVYPFQYMESLDKFEETSLPRIENF